MGFRTSGVTQAEARSLCPRSRPLLSTQPQQIVLDLLFGERRRTAPATELTELPDRPQVSFVSPLREPRHHQIRKHLFVPRSIIHHSVLSERVKTSERTLPHSIQPVTRKHMSPTILPPPG
jgi:hypothetical protein